VRADQRLLVVLIERVHRDEPRRERDRGIALVRGEAGERGLAQDRLGLLLDVPAFGEQPHFEGRARRDVHALEELAAEARKLERLDPGPLRERPHVDERVGRQVVERRGIPPQGIRHREQPSHLGEVPPESAERVVRVPEQELRELVARRRPPGKQQVREQGPRLLASGRGAADPVDLDRRRA
jgi:hypothetical protein